MPQLSADRYSAEIEASTAGLAEIVAEHDLSLPIPTCPEWTLRQLVTHVGRAHRWAAEITRTRSDVPIPFREVPNGKLPDDRAGQCAWLRAGAALIMLGQDLRKPRCACLDLGGVPVGGELRHGVPP